MLNKQTAKLIAVIAQNLPEMSDEAMQRHIDDPKGVQNILHKAFLAFPIIMAVNLGTGLKSADGFRYDLKRFGRKFGDWASNMMDQSTFKVASQLTELSIIALTVAELGFKDGARYADICQRGVSLGYGLCPPELGPQLRIQYQNQPKGQVLRLAMKPIRLSGGGLLTFAVEHCGDGLWLSAYYASPVHFYCADSRFVFACRK
ncbi:MAG: hypothetical protein Q8O32_01165 [bacterium]|nr:hypothetical protein [bacterium]